MKILLRLIGVVVVLCLILLAFFFYSENQKLRSRVISLQEQLYAVGENEDQLEEQEQDDWSSFSNEISAIFSGDFANREPSITEEVDITGDGVTEVLVNTGSGGATMDEFAILMLVDGQPKIVEIQQEDGSIKEFGAMSGSGGSGRYGGSIKLLPDQNSFSSSFYSVYGEESDTCSVSVYTWDSSMKLFVFNSVLSDIKTQELSVICDNMAEGLNY